MVLILYLPHLSATMVFLLLFLYGLSNVGVATCYAVASEMVDAKIAATSMSFANMSSVIIGAFFQPIIGGLLDYYSQINHSLKIDGVIQHSADDYRNAMILLPVCFGVGLFASLFLKETFDRL